MKKYVLRSLGWIFDDDWYNFDDVQDLVDIYDSKEEAIQKKQYLEFLLFLNQLPYIGRYQTKFLDSNLKLKPEFIDTKKAQTLLAEKLNLKKEELFESDSHYPSFFHNKKHLLKNVSLIDIQEIMEAINLNFFRIIEFDSEEIFFYHIKKNNGLSEWGTWEEDNSDFYFYDSRDRNPMVKEQCPLLRKLMNLRSEKMMVLVKQLNGL